MFRSTIIYLLFFFCQNAIAAQGNSEIMVGDFKINTYGQTCLQPNPLAKCILQKARLSLKSKMIVAPNSTRVVSSDATRIEFGFMAVSELNVRDFYKIQVRTDDQNGWTENEEYISENHCSNNGPATQIFHVSKTIYKTAEIYTYELGEPSVKVGDLDIQSCLLP